jgi:hypothetical protein
MTQRAFSKPVPVLFGVGSPLAIYRVCLFERPRDTSRSTRVFFSVPDPTTVLFTHYIIMRHYLYLLPHACDTGGELVPVRNK